MNRRKFFRALSALAALPFVPKFLNAQPITPCPWDIEKYDETVREQWMPITWQSMDGPTMMDWGGDAGIVATYIHTYEQGFVREKFYYAHGWGFIKHTRERRVNGIYVTEWVVLGANTRDKKWETIEA
jgi:hypothetical protein